ncbi:MAG: universal stress protein [Nitrospira sp.]|nr:universal stress protein [Nitrospira sp.]
MTTITPGDQPLFAPEQTFRSHTSAKNILIAVDDSDESAHTLHYVGALLRDIQEVKVTLFHVLNPMPRELMEHGGSEDPETEDHLGEKLRKDQEEWLRAEGALEYPILTKALEQLGQTGFPLDHVTLKLGYERDIADSIMDEARAGGYGTIVVTRHRSTGTKRLFGSGIIDRLLRDLSGVALWVLG